MGAVASADVIREDALDKFGNPALWYYVPDRTYLPLTTNSTTIGTAGLPNSSAIGQGIQDLFGVNRRYGKGAFHLAMRNNVGDIHGDGIDHGVPPCGNSWRMDPPQFQTVYVNGSPTNSQVYPGDPVNGFSGTFDPMIDGDGQAILIVTATLPDGTCRQMEVFLAYPFTSGGPTNAIQDNGDISMQGNFRVQGTLGNVFANGNITGNGSNNATVSGGINAAGSNTVSMQNTPAGGINSGVSPIPIEPIDVTQFLTDPKHSRLRENMFVLNANGTYAKMSGTTAVPQTLPAAPVGWKFQGNKWVTAGSTPPKEAVYYINGDFTQTGAGPDMQMTIIATGSVELGGNSKFTAAHYNDPITGLPSTNPLDSTGQLVVAGADIKLTGNGIVGGVQYDGSFFANEQVVIRGTFDMNGSITGANSTDTPGSAVSSTSSLSDPDLTIGGTPTIIYNGGGSIIQQNVDHLNVRGIHRTR
jgi:hypothetical protein